MVHSSNAELQSTLETALKKRWEVHHAANPSAAIALLGDRPFDVVITDDKELIREGRRASPATSFVWIADAGIALPGAETQRLGADCYLSQPLELAYAEHQLTQLQDCRTMSKGRQAAAARGGSRPDEVPPLMDSHWEGDLNATLESLEYRILLEMLTTHHFNQVKAAEALGITRGALQYKMKKYGLLEEKKAA